MEGERDRAAKREPAERAPAPTAQRPALGVEPPMLGNRAMLAVLASRRQQATQPPSDPTQLGGGRPLPAPLRAEMEGRFGESFATVQVHADVDAGHAAQQHDARAYTVGDDIVFGHGEYQPGTSQGKRLVAHELAHVVQQKRGQALGGTPDHALTEGEAHRAADRAGSIKITEAAPHGIQKQDLGYTPTNPKVTHSYAAEQATVSVNGSPIVVGWVGADFRYGESFDPTSHTLLIEVGGVATNTLEFTGDASETLNNAARNYDVRITEKHTEFHGEKEVVSWHPKDRRSRFDAPKPPPPKTSPNKPQPTIPPNPKKPGPAPGQPQVQPQPAPKVEPPSPYQHINYPVGPQQPAFDQMKQALDAGDLATAAKLANQATDAELRSLTSLQRSLLLWSLGLHPENDTLDIGQVERIMNNTPDGQVQDLQRALSAGNGQLLNALKAHAKGDALQRLGQAMTGLLARSIESGEPDWSLPSMLDQPELEIPKGQPLQWLGDKPYWAKDLQAWKDDKGGWNFYDEEHGLTQLDPFGKQISKRGFPGSELIEKMRKQELRDEQLKWTGGKRYVPGKGLLDESQWLDHIAERKGILLEETNRKIENLESGTQIWMETQDGIAYLASGPSHLFGGRSFGDPAKIVAGAKEDQASALRDMDKAVVPTELDEAEGRLKYAPRRGDRLFYEYRTDVEGGAETTIVVIKGTAIVATVVVAAPVVGGGGFAFGAKGFGTGLGLAVGGGMGFSAGTQGIQILAGERKGFSVEEMGYGGAAGGALYMAPFLAPYAMGYGMYSAQENFEHGRPVSGTLDLFSTAAGPAIAKGVPEAIQFAKPRAARVLMLGMMGLEDGMGGLPPSIPNRPNIVMVDPAGRPMSFEFANPRAGTAAPSSTATPNPSAFVGPSSSSGTGIPQIPFYITLGPSTPSPNPALAGPLATAKGYGANPVTIDYDIQMPGAPIRDVSPIGASDRYWRFGATDATKSDYIDPAIVPFAGLSKPLRATEDEHPYATKGVQSFLPSWSKGAAPAIRFGYPASRIKTPIDLRLIDAVKKGTITPEQFLKHSRANIYRSWYVAREQGIPVPTESELTAAVIAFENKLRQEMGAAGLSISW